MTTTYGIITIAQFETFIGYDFSTFTDAAGNIAFSDSTVESWISAAESRVRQLLKTSYDSTASEDIKNIVKEVAEQYAYRKLLRAKLIYSTDLVEGIKTDKEIDEMITSRFGDVLKVGEIKSIIGVDDY